MEAFGILLLAGIAWLWLDSLKAREAAIRAARLEAVEPQGARRRDCCCSTTRWRSPG